MDCLTKLGRRENLDRITLLVQYIYIVILIYNDTGNTFKQSFSLLSVVIRTENEHDLSFGSKFKDIAV